MHCRCHVSFVVCFYKCCVAGDHLHVGRHQPDDKDDDDDVRWKCNLPSALFYISVLPQPPSLPATTNQCCTHREVFPIPSLTIQMWARMKILSKPLPSLGR